DHVVEEAGPDCVYRAGPVPPVTVEVPEAPQPQLRLVAMDVQPVGCQAPDGDAVLGEHTPCDGIHVESRAGREPPRAVRGDGHRGQRRPAQVLPPDKYTVTRERPTPGPSNERVGQVGRVQASLRPAKPAQLQRAEPVTCDGHEVDVAASWPE